MASAFHWIHVTDKVLGFKPKVEDFLAIWREDRLISLFSIILQNLIRFESDDCVCVCRLPDLC